MTSVYTSAPERSSSLALFDRLSQVVEYLLATSQQNFPVVDGGRVGGVLTRADLMKSLSCHGEALRVDAVMRRDFKIVHPGDMLEAALGLLQVCDCQLFPVVQDDHLVGLLNAENLANSSGSNPLSNAVSSANPRLFDYTTPCL